MPRKREIDKIVFNFCFKNRDKITDFTLLHESGSSLVFYREKDEKVITFDRDRVAPINYNLSMTERVFTMHQIKLFPYRKNSRKYIVLTDTHISNRKILKYKIKKLGLKSFTLKREEVRVGVKGWYSIENLGRTVKRKQLILNILDPEEFGAFYMHFSDLIQNQKYRIS